MKRSSLFLTLTALALMFTTSASAWALPSQWPSKWLDRSHKIFFPADDQETITLSQKFPAFWWNFVVFETADDQASWDKANEVCQSLKALTPELMLRVECNQGIEELRSFAKDWAQDLPVRSDRPSVSSIREKLDGSLAKAALPTGDRGLLTFLQEDPMETWQDLRKLPESHLKLDLERRNGFFYDPSTHRVVIPVQIAFEPGATAKTRSILSSISGISGRPSISLIGPHGSTLRNEERVATDLSSVSKVAYVILALFGVALFSLRRWRLLLLFPPVFVAVGFGAAVTIFIFGSIHGLTLSFGTGIVGLALDYGFNGALNDRSNQRQTWRSNLIGVTTTLVGLFVLMESTIPLLRQMMVFSATGLTFGFLIFHFLIRKFPETFITPALGIPFSPTRNKTWVVVFLLALSVVGLFTLHPNLDMKQFDFQDEKTKGVADWLYKKLDLRAPLLTVNSGPQALASAHHEKDWADHEGVVIENLANYLPSEQQASHLKTWNEGEQSYCQKLPHELPEVQRKFFSKFIDETLCRTQVARLTSTGNAPGNAVRSYTWHLNSGDRWITLWMPSSDVEEAKVRTAWPKSRSLREAVLAFPMILAKELSWMAPLSLAIVFLILFLYYRRLRYCMIALVPFFSGLGLFTLVVRALRLDVSFISVIALVMSFGFSFDYAVFAVDHYIFKKGEAVDGVWEAISSAAFATLAGFIPLLFCRHPVLKHLGQALCLSTIGCYIGAVWGVPGLLQPRHMLKTIPKKGKV